MPLAYKPQIFLSRPSSPVVLDYGFTNTWTTWGVMHFIWTQIQLCGGLVSHRSLKAIFWREMTDELDLVDGSRAALDNVYILGHKIRLRDQKKARPR